MTDRRSDVGGERGGVEFLTDDDAGWDESECMPDHAGRPLTGRVSVLIAALVVVLGLVVFLVGHRPSSSADRAVRSQPTATAKPPVIPSFSAAPPTLGPDGQIVVFDPSEGETLNDTVQLVLPNVTTMPACPPGDDGSSLCNTLARVPSGFLAAVRDRFPGLRQDSALSASLRPGEPGTRTGLWARSFAGHHGDLTLRVLVTRGSVAHPLLLSQGDDGSGNVIASQQNVDGYTISVQVGVPSGHSVSWSAVQRLAADRRLITG